MNECQVFDLHGKAPNPLVPPCTPPVIPHPRNHSVAQCTGTCLEFLLRIRQTVRILLLDDGCVLPTSTRNLTQCSGQQSWKFMNIWGTGKNSLLRAVLFVDLICSKLKVDLAFTPLFDPGARPKSFYIPSHWIYILLYHVASMHLNTQQQIVAASDAQWKRLWWYDK